MPGWLRDSVEALYGRKRETCSLIVGCDRLPVDFTCAKEPEAVLQVAACSRLLAADE